jgi:hypothetical protein
VSLEKRVTMPPPRPDQRHDRVVGEGVFVRCRAGHLLTEDRWRIYLDNIAMARWLQSRLPVLLALRSAECCT